MEEPQVETVSIDPGAELQLAIERRQYTKGELVFFDFELCEILATRPWPCAEGPGSIVCELKPAGGGRISGDFDDPRELVTVTLRTWEFTRMFRAFYDNLWRQYERDIRNWPAIKRFVSNTWQNYCWAVFGAQDLPMHHAPQLLRSLELEFEAAIKQIRSAKVRGIPLVV